MRSTPTAKQFLKPPQLLQAADDQWAYIFQGYLHSFSNLSKVDFELDGHIFSSVEQALIYLKQVLRRSWRR